MDEWQIPGRASIEALKPKLGYQSCTEVIASLRSGEVANFDVEASKRAAAPEPVSLAFS